MRLVGEVNEMRALHVSNALSRKKIEHRLEMHGAVAQIWVADEDRFEEAKEIFIRVSREPIPMWVSSGDQTPPPPKEKGESLPLATYFFLALCVVVYLIEAFQHSETVQLSPIQRDFLYDLPAAVDQSTVVSYWKGIYDIILLKAKTGSAAMAIGEMFGKIREGEVWRLFTPCLLHGSFLHILFNMIWLWVLGRPIEQRIGPWKTILFTLLIGISTNTVQYLVSGPFFLGYSGVVMGLAGFIWMRERIAPWEGYPLNRTTIIFLGVFIFSMFALQTASFFIQLFTNLPFILNIANSAHIAGALFGALLARASFFSWRLPR